MVVRATGLLIWQVTWEPVEGLQPGPCSATTFLFIVSLFYKTGERTSRRVFFFGLATFVSVADASNVHMARIDFLPPVSPVSLSMGPKMASLAAG